MISSLALHLPPRSTPSSGFWRSCSVQSSNPSQDGREPDSMLPSARLSPFTLAGPLLCHSSHSNSSCTVQFGFEPGRARQPGGCNHSSSQRGIHTAGLWEKPWSDSAWLQRSQSRGRNLCDMQFLKGQNSLPYSTHPSKALPIALGLNGK